MKQVIIILTLIITAGPGFLYADNPGKEKLLFTLTPKNGFFRSNQELAFLDGRINSYYPADGFNPDGYVSFSFYDNGNESDQHVRLWSTAHGNQKMRAEFDIETNCIADSNFFSFSLLKDDGDYLPLGQPFIVAGASRQTFNVAYNTDNNGIAQVRMIATRKPGNKCNFLLRSIKVFQLD